jgi:predicted esterase
LSNIKKEESMRKFIFPLCLLLLAANPLATQTQEKEKEFSTYMEMRKHLGELYQQKKLEEAADLLEWAITRFPDHLEANAFNLALIYGQLKEYNKGIKIFKYAFDRGVWFDANLFNQEVWAPVSEKEEFKKMLSRNEALRQKAQRHTKPEILVFTPEKYNRQKKYPLFIALHGGGGNIEEFRKVWKSKKLENEFITAYLQSSQIVSMNGYSWTEDIERAKKEIADAFFEIIKNNSVNENEVIIGGFSSGGVAALEVSFGYVIPVKGFVVLCPAKPSGFNNEMVREAKNRGLCGTLLTTEMDPRLPAQKEMADVFKAENFPHQLIITPDIGHWFPEDIDVQIDRAIGHIRKKVVAKNRENFLVLKDLFRLETAARDAGNFHVWNNF